MQNQPKVEKDGMKSGLGGVNSGQHPSLINPEEISFGYNITLRGGGLGRTRPKVMQRALLSTSDEQAGWFKGRRCTGIATYTDQKGKTSLVIPMAGRLFNIDVANDYAMTEITAQRATQTTANFISPASGETVSVTVTDSDRIFEGYPLRINDGEYLLISRSGNNLTVKNVGATAGVQILSGAAVSVLDPNDPNLDLCWFKQVEHYLVNQNGLDGALVFNGSTCVRRPQIPVGKMMEYSQGRLWVVTNDRQVAAGDQNDPFNPETVLTFDEEKEVALAGRFNLLNNPGNINAIRAIPNVDTSTGQGPLLVFTDLEIGTINVPTDRTQWKLVNYPVTRPVQLNYGGTSQYSVVVTSSDVWNRALDGIRSFILANAGYNEWANVPQSREISRALDSDTEELLRFSSGVIFDNRLLMTYGPRPTPNGVRHKGFVVLDFDAISGLSKRDMPAYEGVWSGFSPVFVTTGIFNGSIRCFAICLNANNENELWEITSEFGLDNDLVRPKCWIETRCFDFKKPDDLKRLSNGTAWRNELVGMVDWTWFWRPDYAECWVPWGTQQDCAKSDTDCTDDVETCKLLKTHNPGYRTRMEMGQPPDISEVQDNKPARLGYLHQVRIEWVGQAAVKRILLQAEEVPESEYQVARK